MKNKIQITKSKFQTNPKRVNGLEIWNLVFGAWNFSTRPLRSSRGSYLVLMAMMTVIFAGLGGVIFEMNKAMTLKSHMQHVADLAAMAAAREYTDKDGAVTLNEWYETVQGVINENKEWLGGGVKYELDKTNTGIMAGYFEKMELTQDDHGVWRDYQFTVFSEPYTYPDKKMNSLVDSYRDMNAARVVIKANTSAVARMMGVLGISGEMKAEAISKVCVDGSVTLYGTCSAPDPVVSQCRSVAVHVSGCNGATINPGYLRTNTGDHYEFSSGATAVNNASYNLCILRAQTPSSTSVPAPCTANIVDSSDECTDCDAPVGPPCPNGVVQPSLDEECDDGNAVDGDECTNTCQCPAAKPDLSNGHCCPTGQTWNAVTSACEAPVMVGCGAPPVIMEGDYIKDARCNRDWRHCRDDCSENMCKHQVFDGSGTRTLVLDAPIGSVKQGTAVQISGRFNWTVGNPAFNTRTLTIYPSGYVPPQWGDSYPVPAGSAQQLGLADSAVFSVSYTAPSTPGIHKIYFQSVQVDGAHLIIRVTGYFNLLVDAEGGLDSEGNHCCPAGQTWNGTACVELACGNGIFQPRLEQCDDGNTIAGDGCSPTCKKELFGYIRAGYWNKNISDHIYTGLNPPDQWRDPINGLFSVWFAGHETYTYDPDKTFQYSGGVDWYTWDHNVFGNGFQQENTNFNEMCTGTPRVPAISSMHVTGNGWIHAPVNVQMLVNNVCGGNVAEFQCCNGDYECASPAFNEFLKQIDGTGFFTIGKFRCEEPAQGKNGFVHIRQHRDGFGNKVNNAYTGVTTGSCTVESGEWSPYPLQDVCNIMKEGITGSLKTDCCGYTPAVFECQDGGRWSCD